MPEFSPWGPSSSVSAYFSLKATPSTLPKPPSHLSNITVLHHRKTNTTSCGRNMLTYNRNFPIFCPSETTTKLPVKALEAAEEGLLEFKLIKKPVDWKDLIDQNFLAKELRIEIP